MLLLLPLLYEALALQLPRTCREAGFGAVQGRAWGHEVLWGWRSDEGNCCKGRDPGTLWGKLEEFERSHDSTERSL